MGIIQRDGFCKSLPSCCFHYMLFKMDFYCFVFFFFLDACFFPNERQQKGCRFEWVKKWEGSGNSWGRGKHSQKIVHEKHPFSIKRKGKKKWTAGNWLLPSEGESTFIKSVASGRSTMLQWMTSYPRAYGQHTSWTPLIRRK